MSLDSKVVWSEGMFLNPQHFQQQERYIERYIDGKCSVINAYGWGLSGLNVDQQLLKLGKISILSASGVYQDGTPFNFPDIDHPPPVLEIPENTVNTTVYIGIPVKRPGAVDILDDDNSQALARYFSYNQLIRDVVSDSGENITVNVGKLRCRLLLETDDLSGYTCIGIMKIAEIREDKEIILEKDYIPSCTDINVAPSLSSALTEFIAMLHQRGEMIASRIADTNRGGTAEIADYMLLQLINRIEPMIRHLASIKGLHPLQLYSELIQITGEISTFSASSKRPPKLSVYLHDKLLETFQPVIRALRECLTMVYEQTAISLNLVEKKYGIRVSEIPDKTLFSTAIFVLAVRSNIPENILRSNFPGQVKIGPVERIRQLVNAAIPGIALKALPVAPRQIPYHSGYTYFELEKNSELWKELPQSGGLALHVGGDFPGMELEFWAIRQA